MDTTKGLQSNGVSMSSGSPPDNIQDSVSRLSIQDAQPDPYPSRAGESDCIHYLRTGSCTYGTNCRYNHPPYIEQGAQYGGEFPERVGQPDCQYFLKTRTCKFGATCKYNHPRDSHDAPPVPLNILGLPMRQDEKSCPFYMRTGSCKFGILCKFNHPQPSALGSGFPVTGPSTYVFPGSSVAPPSGLPLISGFSSWPLARAPYISNPRTQGLPAYMPIVPPPSQGTMPVQQGWCTYTGSMSHARLTTDALGTTQTPNSTHPHLGSSTPVNLLEKPDQPECQYYMKTGNCKYGTSCKYHHPKERNSLAAIGPHGLPLRPGRAVCTVYTMYGTCNYGSACRFDHPLVGYYFNYGLPALSTPGDDRPPLVFPDQRCSQVLQESEAAAETLSLPDDRLVKSDEPSNGGLQDRKEHGDPPPSDTAPSESPRHHSD